MNIRSHSPCGPRLQRSVKLQLLHTNDIHGSLQPVNDRVVLGRKAPLGGAAYLAEVLNEARESQPNTLVFDSGDSVSGQVSSDLNQGRSMVEAMNKMGYSAATIGNHDFDFYVDSLLQRLNMAEYPVVVTNTRFEDGSALPNTQSSKIIETPDLKVGVLGLLTEDMDEVTIEEKRRGIRFEDPEDALEREIPKLRRRGADVIVVLSHNGLEEDIDLAEDFRDQQLVFLGAHSHDRLTEPMKVHGNYIFQAGSHGKELGRVQLEVDPSTDTILGVDSELLLVDPSRTKPHVEVGELVKRYAIEAEEALGAKVGYTPTALTRNYHRDSLLGNWVTDAFREKLGTEIALINADGLRADISEGEISRGQVREVRPFDGMSLYRGEIEGRHLKEALEHSTTFRETDPEAHSSFLQVSGVRFSYDRNRPEGDRVFDIRVGGEELQLGVEYSIACENYLAAGQLGYESLKEGDFQETGLSTLEVLEEYAGSFHPTNLSESERIHDLTAK